MSRGEASPTALVGMYSMMDELVHAREKDVMNLLVIMHRESKGWDDFQARALVAEVSGIRKLRDDVRKSISLKP